MVSKLYSREFFERREAAVASSAAVISSAVLDLLQSETMPLRRLLDVGCGQGAWLNAFQRLGISDCWGVDGEYVDPDLLQFPVERFLSADLEAGLPEEALALDVDLVVFLEVAEHLTRQAAERITEQILVRTPVVLFSAAIPGQPGEGHINCQWQSYWLEFFLKRGFIAIDAIRPQVWNDARVSWWYAQNAFLFIKSESVKEFPNLAGYPIYSGVASGLIDVVHPALTKLLMKQSNPVRRLLRFGMNTLPPVISARLRTTARG